MTCYLYYINHTLTLIYFNNQYISLILKIMQQLHINCNTYIIFN